MIESENYNIFHEDDKLYWLWDKKKLERNNRKRREIINNNENKKLIKFINEYGILETIKIIKKYKGI